MKWLVDSNVLSEQVRTRPKASVIAWIAQQNRQQIVTSVVVLAELRRGAMAQDDAERRRELADWIEREVSDFFAGRMLSVTVEVLIDWLELIKRTAASSKTCAPADLLIASTARVHDLVVVTRNVRDFANTGVVVYNPWTGETHNMEPP